MFCASASAESFLKEPPSNHRMDSWNMERVRTGERGTRAAPPNRPPGTACLASDLCQWVAPETLVNLVLSVVQHVDEARLRPALAERAAMAPPGRLLLALLVCAYAKGIYLSHAIAESATEDAALHYLGGGLALEGSTLRRFRNHNRETIAQCLETVCLAAWRIKFGGWRCGLPSDGRQGTGLGQRLDALVQMEIKCEVMERLQRAEVEDYRGYAEAALVA